VLQRGAAIGRTHLRKSKNEETEEKGTQIKKLRRKGIRMK
jgi:hypothetical protein